MSGIIQIRPVSREEVKFVIGISSVSGDGKTRSALELAHGLTDFKPEKIGLLDCENRRGSLYAELFEPKRFLIADLIPPFSPDRYIQSMRTFAEADIEVLIIDSYSHVWEGEGGIEDIVNRPKADGTPRKGPDWIEGKRQHKRFVNTCLFLPMHVILCVRAREKSGGYGPGEKIHSLGVQPICEKNLMFEMTMSWLLTERGTKRNTLKLMQQHESLVGMDGYLTAEHGKNLRNWLGGFDVHENCKNNLRLAATQGMEQLKMAWDILNAKQKVDLKGFKETLKPLAIHADEEFAMGLKQQQLEQQESQPLV